MSSNNDNDAKVFTKIILALAYIEVGSRLNDTAWGKMHVTCKQFSCKNEKKVLPLTPSV